MEFRTLGRTGLRVSAIGFGGAPAGIPNYVERWDPSGDAEAASLRAAIEHALDLGINYFDTAPSYGDGISEEIFGRALAQHRGRFVLATKVGARDPEGIRASVEASLRRLQVDCLDVIQFHGGWYSDEEAERILAGDGLEALERLRDGGKVRFLGFTAEGPTGGASRMIASGRFDLLQVRYNLMYGHTCDFVNEAGLIREARAQGMGVLTMRTLTSGILQKLLTAHMPEVPHKAVDSLALNYVLSNPFIDCALVGMRRPEEVDANTAVLNLPRLDLPALHHRFAG